MSLLSLSFTAPWVLLALAGAPLLYLLLRVTPPPPQRIAFPPLKLILDLKKPDATPARTPLWLLILRMALAALVVLAMAGPVLAPSGAPAGRNGPLLLLVDDGWPAASDWALRMSVSESRLDAAAREGRPAAILALSESPPEALAPQDAAGALERLRALKPKAFLPSREPALKTIAAFVKDHDSAQVVWVTDGMEDLDGHAFASKLADLAPDSEILRDRRAVQVIAGADNGAAAMDFRLARSAPVGPTLGRVRAYDGKGASLGDAEFDFADRLDARASFDLPVQLRN
ncbi:MAG TPA: BatA domain-containing protein, partial [Rhodoblastus sp.]|nr:BatA domain-containing protein [Rhodoblastus sp.]